MYKQHFTLYFLNGTNPNKLSQQNQLRIHRILSQDKYTDSYLIYNHNDFSRKQKQWQQNLSYIKPYYAMKSNPSQQILNDIKQKNIGIDVGSKNQILLCQKLNININNIIYSNTIKCENDLIYAQKIGIKLTVADTIQQLIKIKKFAPNIQILWRIAMKNKNKIQNNNKLNNFFCKFGDDLNTEQQIQKRMKQISQLGIKLKGIHFNTGPSKYGCDGFDKGIEKARQCIIIGRKYGHIMNILNVGGGFPAGKLNDKIINDLKQAKNDQLKYQIIAEPGRFFSSQPFYLLVRVIGKKQQNNRMYYYLNQSIYQSLRQVQETQGFGLQNSSNQFYSKFTQNTQNNNYSNNSNIQQKQQMISATFYGMTCSRNDILIHNIQVPKNLSIGDWLCIGGIGAYTTCFTSNYNGMKDNCKIVRI